VGFIECKFKGLIDVCVPFFALSCAPDLMVGGINTLLDAVFVYVYVWDLLLVMAAYDG
jgi:hypothetical protein